MSSLPTPRLTPEEYLALERQSDHRSEYFNGEIFAMSGGSRHHDWIAGDLTMLIKSHLRRSSCVAYTANMKVRTAEGLFTYPDLAVACGEHRFFDAHTDTLLNPVFVIEILSPSTEAYDRGRKAESYRTIPTLRELLFISQDRLHVELLRRGVEGGPWTLDEAGGIDGSIELTTISYRLRLAELYETAMRFDETGRYA